ncbi:hypothetical protein GCM10010523_10730 [Paenarthrobacter ilicis]
MERRKPELSELLMVKMAPAPGVKLMRVPAPTRASHKENCTPQLKPWKWVHRTRPATTHIGGGNQGIHPKKVDSSATAAQSGWLRYSQGRAE